MGGNIRFDRQSGEIVEVASPAVLVMPVDAVNDPVGLLSPHAEPEFKENALAVTVPEVVA